MQVDKPNYHALFSSPAGKFVLEDILSFAHVLEAPSVESDPHTVMFKAGRRDVAMYILEQIKVKSLTEIIND